MGLNPFPEATIRAITFDAGDTLIFDRPSLSERIETALGRSGIAFDSSKYDSSLKAMISLGTNLYLQGKTVDDPEFIYATLTCLLTNLGSDFDDDSISRISAEYQHIGYDRYLHSGATLLIETLHQRGFKIGMISDWEPDLSVLLESLGCLHLFDSVSVSSLVGATKPNKELFQDAISKLKVQPDEIVHVGDYLELDIEGARNSGMHAILFDSNGQYSDADIPCPTVSTFDQLSEMLLDVPVP